MKKLIGFLFVVCLWAVFIPLAIVFSPFIFACEDDEYV